MLDRFKNYSGVDRGNYESTSLEGVKNQALDLLAWVLGEEDMLPPGEVLLSRVKNIDDVLEYMDTLYDLENNKSVVDFLDEDTLLTTQQRKDNLAGMDWIPEGLVNIGDDRVIVGNKEVLFIDDTTFTESEARTNDAMRRGDLMLLFRVLLCTKDQFTNFCEGVFGLNREQKYRTSSNSRRGISHIVSFNGEDGFTTSPDGSVGKDEKLPAMFIRDK